MGNFLKKVSFIFSLFLASLFGQSHGECCKNSDPFALKFWADGEYLYWKIKNSPEPVPLVINQQGKEPFTVVLGDEKLNLGWRSGAKVSFGCGFNENHRIGAEVNYLFLSKNSNREKVSSDANGSPPLRVPFFNVQTGLEDSGALATPNLFQGSALLKIDNKMQGAELNLTSRLPSDNCHTQFVILAGFRWWNFNEQLKFFANSPTINPPSIYNYGDTFHVKNNFYGGQMGFDFNYHYGAMFMNLKGKVALGALYQETLVKGFFTTNEFTGQEETFIGGFFALPTNIGKDKHMQVSLLPELNINLGYQCTDALSIHLGYSLLYVNHVLFAGKQIDKNINPSQSANIDFTATPALVGEPSPKKKTHSDDFFAQGLNAGLEFQF